MRDRIGQAELGIAAQRLDVGGHAVELLRQHLRGAEHGAARRRRIRAGRQRLQRVGEIVEDRLERAVGAGLAVDALQPVVELRAQVGVARRPSFRSASALHILIELAVDRGDADADRRVAGGGRDLDRASCGHSPASRRSPRWRRRATAGLRGAQAGDGGGERLGEDS